MKLLIDECLSPELAKLAQSRGHANSSHVVWLKKSGWKDWRLKQFILEGDWTFVTNNAIDFRGPSSGRGSKGQYSDVALHAGLICLNTAAGMNLDLQLELFELALDEIGGGDLVNQVLESRSMRKPKFGCYATLCPRIETVRRSFYLQHIPAQNFSTHGRTSISQVQALRCCCTRCR